MFFFSDLFHIPSITKQRKEVEFLAQLDIFFWQLMMRNYYFKIER